MAMIIDDGVQKRIHRKNIFNPGFRTTGISCVHHNVTGMFTVVKYAFYYVSRKLPDKAKSIIEEWNSENKVKIDKTVKESDEYTN